MLEEVGAGLDSRGALDEMVFLLGGFGEGGVHGAVGLVAMVVDGCCERYGLDVDVVLAGR